ncbi:MAG: dUTP diphosphatase [Flavobacteriaceae bacterium]|tara:strand:- start:66 stop:500 length:435 start_codon:yes stop_codon:yes gene_type:complete
MKIKIINKSNNETPKYESEKSAGMDIRAFVKQELLIKPLERILVKTGLYMELPNNVEAQIRPRSGLALKKGITVLNSPGTIDADYRGEIGIILINLSKENFIIKSGDRIAQMVITKHESINWEVTSKLARSERGSSGFGSTGLK